jgi:hypothetical protein
MPGARLNSSRIRAAIWFLLAPDFFIFLLFVIPIAHHWVDLEASKSRGLVTDTIGSLLPVWLFGSTVLATILLAVQLWRQRKSKRQNGPEFSVRPNIAVVAGWWVALLGLLGYGYALGMGG